MLRKPTSWAAALFAVALSPLAAAQNTIQLEVDEQTSLDWTGASSAGALVSDDTNADVRGRLRITITQSSTGREAELGGVLRLEPIVGTALDPIGNSIARAAFSDVALRLDSDPAQVAPLPGGGMRLDLDVRAGFESGTLGLDPPGGTPSTTDLAGTPADRFRLVARLVNDGGTWRLAGPLRLQLRFDDDAGFFGAFRLRGGLRAAEPCDPSQPFCAQGDGAPRLRSLPPDTTGTSPVLRFAARTDVPDASVVLFGGMRQPPQTVAAGDLCIGAPRRVLATAMTDASGNARLDWEPGAAGLALLSSGSFGAQAIVAGQPGEFTNALALQLCD